MHFIACCGNGSTIRRNINGTLTFGLRYARDWDDPELRGPMPERIHPEMIEKEF